MIKTFHEAPKSIFKDVQGVTDGDYALVNLFEEDPEYLNLFKQAVADGREVILDNGVFELGEAFDSEVFASWVRELKPTYYIVPDVLEDGVKTVERFFEFMQRYPDLPGKVIGVAQGRTYEEFVECYRAIAPHCAKIGISFDCSWYKKDMLNSNPWLRQAGGRLRTLCRMEQEDIIISSKEHHLLGVSVPQEMQAYRELQSDGSLTFITSVDTSNPVVHGLKGIVYSEDGLENKETQKLYTMINSEVSDRQYKDIMYNIEMFRRFCNG